MPGNILFGTTWSTRLGERLHVDSSGGRPAPQSRGHPRLGAFQPIVDLESRGRRLRGAHQDTRCSKSALRGS